MIYTIVDNNVCLTFDDGCGKSFPVNNNNPEYIEWLSEKDKWTLVETPVYVQQGPTPEEIAEAETKVLITETLIELGVLS